MTVLNKFGSDEVVSLRENDVCTFCAKKIMPPCVYFNRGKAVLICMDCCSAWKGLAADMIQVSAAADLRGIGWWGVFFERSDVLEVRKLAAKVRLVDR